MLITMVISSTIAFFPLKDDLLLVSIVSAAITMAVHWFFTRSTPNDFNFGITVCRFTTGSISFWDMLILLLGGAAGTAAGISLTMGFVGQDLFWAQVPCRFRPYGGGHPESPYQSMGALACAQFCLYFLGSSYEFVFTSSKKFGKSALIGGLTLALNIATYTFGSGGLMFFYALLTSAITGNLDFNWTRTFLFSNLISIIGTFCVSKLMNYLDIKVTESSKANKE